MVLDDPLRLTEADQDCGGSPAIRVLRVAEAIGLHGPITLNGLSELLPFHRSSIWRAASILKAQGWVRMRLGDHAFELTGRLDMRLADYHFAPMDVESADSLVETILKEDLFHAELCQFVAPGRFAMIESSCRSAEREGLRSLVWDTAALAAQLGMTASERERHLSAFCLRASQTEREIIKSGELCNMLKRSENDGIVWNPSEMAASLPWIGASGASGAVTILARTPSRKNYEKLQAFAQRLLLVRADIGRPDHG